MPSEKITQGDASAGMALFAALNQVGSLLELINPQSIWTVRMVPMV